MKILPISHSDIIRKMKNISTNPKERIIVALDFSTIEEIQAAVIELRDFVGYFKVGLQAINRIGTPKLIQEITNLGGQIFFDGKFHDIPHTMEEATNSIASHVSMFTVHASAGSAALRTVAGAKGTSLLLVVTVLTSLSDEGAQEVFSQSAKDRVIGFAKLAAATGADGIVCSPLELGQLASEQDLAKLIRVTPGIRPSWSDQGDQSRTATPRQAIEWGADYIVIGRPITHPPKIIGSRKRAAQLILEEIS